MKKTIRLTEATLREMIRESVKRILMSEDIQPSAWSAVAQRYAQTDPQKAAYAMQRGREGWNKQYGRGAYRINNNGAIEDTGEMHPVPSYSWELRKPYNPKSATQNTISDNPLYQGYGRTTYTPNTNGTFDLAHSDYSKPGTGDVDREKVFNDTPYVNQQYNQQLDGEGFRQASLMKQGKWYPKQQN